jgi:CheY-like chemotaxis protein
LSSIEAFAPDIVLLDIGLPEMNGYEVAKRIRRMPIGKDVHLFALTGWGQEEDKQRAREAGFDEHLTKPVDMRLLSSLIATAPISH